MYKIILSLLILFNLVVGQTILSGNIGGMELKQSGNPWIITNNIIVEKGSKTIIKPGCILLFKPFTGMEVHGNLIVEGNEIHRVIFTSVNDTFYNQASTQKPGPFEWNGIKIYEGANGISFSNFMLSYSVYGIQSDISNIMIKRGIFRDNGQFNFTVEGRIIYVENNFPFNYSTNSDGIEDFYSIPKNKKDNKYSYLTIGSTILGGAFLCTTGYYTYKYGYYDKKYDEARSPNNINYYYDKKKKSRDIVVFSGVAAGTFSLIGLKFLLFDRIMNKKDGIILSYNIEGFDITILF